MTTLSHQLSFLSRHRLAQILDQDNIRGCDWRALVEQMGLVCVKLSVETWPFMVCSQCFVACTSFVVGENVASLLYPPEFQGKSCIHGSEVVNGSILMSLKTFLPLNI